MASNQLPDGIEDLFTFNLAPPNWVPIVTNPAGFGGALAFTNNPVPGTNNFWRVRSVP